jgi:hypothetical protein
VEVGDGFEALGAVLWTALSNCQAENDIHNASVIMMLSQVRGRGLCYSVVGWSSPTNEMSPNALPTACVIRVTFL